jgi:hypothetical protein
MQASLRAFRALTAAPADGAATRARVLARAGGARERRASWRRFAALALGTTAISISASAAWTTFAPARRAAPAIALADGPEEGPRSARREPLYLRRIPTIPAAQPDVPAPGAALTPDSSDAGSEARAYARAHRAHFIDQAPAQALAAWNDYLRRYPRGSLAPEAQFNRALCLVRLGRFDEATRALQAFAAGQPDGYRQADVERLLGWLRDREPP